MEALAKAKTLGASVGCYAVSTTGEETTGNGAYFTASRVRPNIAIAVDVTYTSAATGSDTTEMVQGFTAVIFQHETDHLDGVLYIDKLVQ